MASIQTILGNIPTNFLGFCQCHEHLMISKGQSFIVNSDLLIDDYSKSKSELLSYRNAGGNSIIDAQPVGCNRMELDLAHLSQETFVNILASTGFHKLIFYPKDHWIHSHSLVDLESIYCTELLDGMFVDSDTKLPTIQCAYRASIIKTAYDTEGLSDRYTRLFQAACGACKKTGAPIMIHIENNTDPTTLLHFMLRQQIQSRKLIFCHLDRTLPNMEILKAILREGCYLEFDTIGRFKYHSDASEVAIIKELLDCGFENQLLCSLDTTRVRLKSYTSDGIGLDYILKDFIPLMKHHGINKEQIRKIFNKNCIHALTK